jgi:outer membrane protein assembly factor BamD
MQARSRIFVAVATAAALAAGTSACRGGFRVNRYSTNESLYAAALREYQQKHWANAILALEKLTNDLPARDTLLPRSYWYLGSAHEHQREHLLAAQSLSRLYESFPDDTLADDAALEAARSYARLWRKPALDATYGEMALATYNTMLGLYGDTSPHAEAARREIGLLEEKFATKNYQTGLFYLRRKAYDSAILYFKYVLERWPHVPRARDALLRLAESYKAIRYRDDLTETCNKLRQTYVGDPDVPRVCADVKVLETPTVAPPRPTSAR